MAYLNDESGITLTELLAVLLLLTVIATLLVTMASHIFTIKNVQEIKLKCQVVANQIYTDLNALSNESLVNASNMTTSADINNLGELGKYKGSWETNQMVRLVDASNDTILSTSSNGVERLKFVRHKDDSELSTYQTPNKDIKLKVHLVKNKHEDQVLRQGETNFRDSFSVQTTVYIVFYKGIINWSSYISGSNVPLVVEGVKKDNKDKIVYTREFEVSYRDDAKSAGEVAGNGRW